MARWTLVDEQLCLIHTIISVKPDGTASVSAAVVFAALFLSLFQHSSAQFLVYKAIHKRVVIAWNLSSTAICSYFRSFLTHHSKHPQIFWVLIQILSLQIESCDGHWYMSEHFNVSGGRFFNSFTVIGEFSFCQTSGSAIINIHHRMRHFDSDGLALWIECPLLLNGLTAHQLDQHFINALLCRFAHVGGKISRQQSFQRVRVPNFQRRCICKEHGLLAAIKNPDRMFEDVQRLEIIELMRPSFLWSRCHLGDLRLSHATRID
mmetsp:Transcript_5231/g.10755  ORF Transcript_5231/g.10755 Transcript_5231/m.10755 type:complete len:263 (+) Transcript_5231:2621-3409(+)